MRESRRVSAVIVTYNSAGEVDACLPPLLAGNVEVVVVDNDSSDGTPELVERRFPEARVVRNPDGNAGFASGCNVGIAEAGGDVVILVNPDCQLDAPAAEVMADVLMGDPGIGVVGPKILDRSGTATNSAHRFETPLSHLAQFAGGRSLPAPLKRAIAALVPGGDSFQANRAREGHESVDWVSGACLAARRETIFELGGLDQGYFMYMEDEDLCLRAQRIGLENRYLPEVVARHTGGASSGRKDLVWPEFYRSILRFQALHSGVGFHLVRAALVPRATIGMIIGLARDGQRRLSGSASERRTLAWARVLKLTMAASRKNARRNWADQTNRRPARSVLGSGPASPAVNSEPVEIR